MIAYYIACKTSGEFADNLLNGVYDHPIHRDLCDIAETERYQGFKDVDPTGFFDFTIELKEEDKFFHIDPWDKDRFCKYNPDVTEFERKANLLLTAVINDKYEDLLRCLRLDNCKSTHAYSVQILGESHSLSPIV